MEVRELQNHIRALATLEETAAPLISCYLDVDSGPGVYGTVLNERVQLLKKSLAGQARADFEEAASRIEEFVTSGLERGTRGAAIFARGGAQPFFLPLLFRVQLPNWIVIGPTPNLYHLVEIKDNYDRFIILLATEESARIIGVNLGAVTEQVWSARPDLRRRVGREWSRDHFQDHRRARSQQFIHEQIHVLEKLLATGGYGHIVLAGNPRATAAIRKAMPKHLARKLLDTVPASAHDRLSDVVASTLQAFLEHEELESQAIAEKLTHQIHTHGLAVAGTSATLDALKKGQADSLVVASAYDPGRGWECRRCRHTVLESRAPAVCQACRRDALREFDIKAEIVRLAEISDCGVEVVEHSDGLMALGGVGCLLRYLAPGTIAPPAA